jgi:hypothetical protein
MSIYDLSLKIKLIKPQALSPLDVPEIKMKNQLNISHAITNFDPKNNEFQRLVRIK